MATFNDLKERLLHHVSGVRIISIFDSLCLFHFEELGRSGLNEFQRQCGLMVIDLLIGQERCVYFGPDSLQYQHLLGDLKANEVLISPFKFKDRLLFLKFAKREEHLDEVVQQKLQELHSVEFHLTLKLEGDGNHLELLFARNSATGELSNLKLL
jgi:hypothetical protein